MTGRYRVHEIADGDAEAMEKLLNALPETETLIGVTSVTYCRVVTWDATPDVFDPADVRAQAQRYINTDPPPEETTSHAVQ